MARATTKKTTAKKTTSKTTKTAKASTAKSTPKTASVASTTQAKPYVVTQTQAAEADVVNVANIVKRKEFMDRVVERSGLKPRDVRPVLDATLATLGEAIEAGESLTLPQLGKMRVNRQKDNPNATVSILRLRRSKEKKAAE